MRALTAITGAACLALAAAWAFPAWSQDKSAGGAAANTQDPSQLVQSVAEGLLKDLDANRDMYRKDPKAMRALVDKHLLPHFDVQYSARLVLGKHNRDITPEQRDRFINAFENSLVQNYGTALVEFTANRLKVLPSHVDPSAKSTTVRSEIRRDDGSTVPVDYTLHMVDGQWKTWDVVISGSATSRASGTTSARRSTSRASMRSSIAWRRAASRPDCRIKPTRRRRAEARWPILPHLKAYKRACTRHALRPARPPAGASRCSGSSCSPRRGASASTLSKNSPPARRAASRST